MKKNILPILVIFYVKSIYIYFISHVVFNLTMKWTPCAHTSNWVGYSLHTRYKLLSKWKLSHCCGPIDGHGE